MSAAVVTLQFSTAAVGPDTDLEIVEGLVVPKGTVVAPATATAALARAPTGGLLCHSIEKPELPKWPTAEEATVAFKKLLGVRKKKAARAEEDDADGADGGDIANGTGRSKTTARRLKSSPVRSRGAAVAGKAGGAGGDAPADDSESESESGDSEDWSEDDDDDESAEAEDSD